MLDEILEVTVWMEKLDLDDQSMVRGFQKLMVALVERSPVFADLVSKNDPDDPGVDLLHQSLPERFTIWHEKFAADFPDDGAIKLVVGAKPFLGPNGESVSSYRVVLFWGETAPYDRLKIEIPMRFSETPDMPPFLTDLVKAVTGWRRSALITAQPSVLKMTGRLFPEHHSAGFGIWMPGAWSNANESDAHQVLSINGGELIIVTDSMFNLGDSAALERVHQVDTYLMQQAALPSTRDYPFPI